MQYQMIWSNWVYGIQMICLKEHIYRAHLQAAIWRSYMDGDPPKLNPVHYGWTIETDTETLTTVGINQNVSPAPANVLKII